MSAIVQTLFSPAVLGIGKVALLAALPDDFDWIAHTAFAALSAVDDVERLLPNPGDGFEKFEAVADVLRRAFDEMDELPGWRHLDEEDRDALIAGLIEIAVFIMKLKDGSASRDAGDALGDAVGRLIPVIWTLFANRRPAPGSNSGPIAALDTSVALTAYLNPE